MANSYWVGSNVSSRNDYEVYLSQTVVSWDELFQLYPISTMQAWGDNTYGQIGDGTTTQRTSPVSIGQNLKWKSVTAASTTSYGISQDNRLFAWGSNNVGQLGTGGPLNSSSIVQVGSDSDWSSVSGGNQACLAIKTNNSLWSWGWDQFGQCGLGTSGSSYSTPQNVTSLGNVWLSASSGGGWSSGITTAGQLYTWGINATGQLGLGDTTYRSTPTLVSGNWLQVSAGNGDHTLAIARDNTLWAWGNNTNGQLGDGTVGPKSTPIQVGTDNTWIYISAGSSFSLAIKSDGTMWGWGNNDYKQLGGTLLFGDVLTPVQVGRNQYTWRQVRAGYRYAMAIKSDGTLWGWGTQTNGEIGIGGTAQVSTPVQVGLLTNWKQVSCTYKTTAAVSWPTTPSS